MILIGMFAQAQGLNRPKQFHSQKFARQKGLTLVEMLIALVLSSIIFVSAYQVISNLIQYQVRAEKKNDVQLEALLTTSMLGKIIEMGTSQFTLYYRAAKKPFFRGEADSLQIVSRAFSRRFDRPGYRVYQVFVREAELIVAYRAYDRDISSSEVSEIGTGLMVEEIGFEYFYEGGWLNQWANEREIPEFIRVTFNFPGQDSIEFVRRTGRR